MNVLFFYFSIDLFSIDASGLLKADVGLDREETPPSYNLIVYVRFLLYGIFSLISLREAGRGD